MSIKVTNNFDADLVARKVKASIGLYADIAAKKMEAEAKSKAPWQNHTTNARNSILGDFEWKNDRAVIILSGNIEYFSYLELAHEKRYAIIYPTILRNAPEILNGYRKLVKG